jgi:DNA repair exonuclease SbcCD ATPase subunit
VPAREESNIGSVQEVLLAQRGDAVEEAKRAAKDAAVKAKRAIKQILREIKDRERLLRTLGYDGSDGRSRAMSRRRRPGKRACSVCGKSGHNSRRHAGEKKRGARVKIARQANSSAAKSAE